MESLKRNSVFKRLCERNMMFNLQDFMCLLTYLRSRFLISKDNLPKYGKTIVSEGVSSTGCGSFFRKVLLRNAENARRIHSFSMMDAKKH